VRRGSSLLELGCGEGMLALLKRKGVELTGVDLSPEFAAQAHRNGYDVTCVAELASLPFDDGSFDYVVSLDLIGHIGFDEKDALIAEIKRVLRPHGVTMHGIEVFNRNVHRPYESMSHDELFRFISIDGHIGLEDEEKNAARFRSFFKHVETEPRYSICLSCDEIIKQSEQYGMEFDADFVDYLRKLSFTERRAFDMAMGYVFGKISDLHVKLPHDGLYIFLKASDAEPGPFYNAHRDRSDLFETQSFGNGWYAANYVPQIARWMGRESILQVETESVSKIKLDLTTHMPELRTKPLGLEFLVNGVSASVLSLFDYGWLELEIPVPEGVRSAPKLELKIRAGRTWKPIESDPLSSDDRELSIAVCNIEVCR
jgi:SAM-dependent methyltransferase